MRVSRERKSFLWSIFIILFVAVVFTAVTGCAGDAMAGEKVGTQDSFAPITESIVDSVDQVEIKVNWGEEIKYESNVYVTQLCLNGVIYYHYRGQPLTLSVDPLNVDYPIFCSEVE